MLYRFFSGDFPITLMLYGIIWFATRQRRSLVRDVMFGDTPFWNRVGQVTVVTALVLPLWAAAADNWRQLLTYSPFLTEKWQSDPFQTPPTPGVLRDITIALGVILVLGLATLYARRAGSPWLPVGAIVFGAAFLNFVDPIRMRVDVLMLQTQPDLSSPQLFNVAFILFWAIGLYFVVAIDILAGLAMAWGLVALPVRLVGWLVTRNRTSNEAPVYRVYRQQVEHLHAGGPAAPNGSGDRDLTRR